MRIFKESYRKYTAAVVVMLFTLSASAQVTMKEVADAFNLGVQFATTNPEVAIKSFEQAIKYADEVGDDEAKGLKANAMAQIPKIYFDWARSLVQKGDLPGGLAQLKNCIAASEKYNTPIYAQNARPTVAAIYLALGNNAMKEKKFDDAISNYNSAIEYDDRSVKAYLGKVLVYNEKEMEEEMVEAAIGGMNINPRPADLGDVDNIRKVVTDRKSVV